MVLGEMNEPGNRIDPSAHEDSPRRRHRWHHFFSFTDYRVSAYLDFHPRQSAGSGEDVVTHSKMISLALNLVPFAGIAFLWFIAVVRDRLGELEDRFFATSPPTAVAIPSASPTCPQLRPTRYPEPEAQSLKVRSGH